MPATFTKIKQRIVTYDEVSSTVPTPLPIQGRVSFVPVLKQDGDVYQVKNGTSTDTVVPQVIDAKIVSGNITLESGSQVSLFAAGPDSNPTQMFWRAEFSNLTVNGEAFEIRDIVFEAIPNGTVDLALAAPVAGTEGMGMVKGDAGDKFHSLVVEGSNLVFRATDFAGITRIVASIPMDKVVAAEAQKAADEAARLTLASKADKVHKHVSADITDSSSNIDSASANKLLKVNANGKLYIPTSNVTSAGDVTNKAYVDQEVGKKANTSHTHGSANITDKTHIITSAAATKIVMIGNDGHVQDDTDPTHANHLTRKSYVDAKVDAATSYYDSGANILPAKEGYSGGLAWSANLTEVAGLTGLPPGVDKVFTASGTRTGDGPYAYIDDQTSYRFSCWVKADIPGTRFYLDFMSNIGHRSVATGTYGADTNSRPIGSLIVPTEWTKIDTVISFKPGVNQIRVGSMYFNHPRGVQGGQQLIANVSLTSIGFARRSGFCTVEDNVTTPQFNGSASPKIPQWMAGSNRVRIKFPSESRWRVRCVSSNTALSYNLRRADGQLEAASTGGIIETIVDPTLAPAPDTGHYLAIHAANAASTGKIDVYWEEIQRAVG